MSEEIVPDAEPDVAPAPTGWNETWREDYAGEDAGKLEQLGRYASPTAAFDALFSARQKISSGEYKKPEAFPGEGSEEDQTAWRASNGIPATADGYELEETDTNKSYLKSLRDTAFANNMSPESASTIAEWAAQAQIAENEARLDADNDSRELNDDTLRSEWGDEYRTNLNRIHGLLDSSPEGFKEQLMDARLKDGTLLGDNADALKWLVDVALAKNPATVIVPAGGDLMSTIGDEVAGLEKMMGNKSSDYWKGPMADKNQARYRELVTAQSKMK